MRIAHLIAAGLLLPLVAHADHSDDTLKFYLAKSDLVVLGTIKNEPVGNTSVAAVVGYDCNVEVADVLKGDQTLKGKTIRLGIVRFESGENDQYPPIKKNTKCILFLKQFGAPEEKSWGTTDLWFSVQYPNSMMAKSLKRLARQEAASQ